MNEQKFNLSVAIVGIGFAIFFFATVVPPLFENPDLMAAVAAGFVNPYAAGYATDAMACWLVLAIWVTYDASAHDVRHGWLCLLLGAIPGVATGFALYLILRGKQLGFSKA
jgi:uncharacterized membrane protein